MQQYFLPEKLKSPQSLTITDQRIVHHVAKVMRMRPKAQFELVSSENRPFLATLTQITPDQKQIEVQIVEALTRHTELPLAVHLICGLPKREKTEWIVQKATELGAQEITFFGGERSVVRWDDKKADKKLARLQSIAQEAGEQSHRNCFPQVHFVKDIKAVAKLAGDTKLFAYEESGKSGEQQVLKTTLTHAKSGTKLLCLFGPEGGISESEVAVLQAADYQATGLGPRILRTETAPLYFLSCVSYASELISS